MLVALALAAGSVYVAEQSSGPVTGQSAIADYQQARPLFWQRVYNRGGETLYCGKPLEAGYNRGVNIEHVFPMAWVTNALKCGRRQQCRESSARFNRIEADMHNLYPARSDVNDARGAMSFGEIPGEKRWRGGCDFELDERRRLVEPRPAARGEIARAMFYMRDTYDLLIFDRLSARLEAWHRADPVSDAERRRNDAIEAVQGNRNPYIDDPGWRDRAANP